jgi:hypothetical protein
MGGRTGCIIMVGAADRERMSVRKCMVNIQQLEGEAKKKTKLKKRTLLFCLSIK